MCNDTKRCAVSLQQLSFLLILIIAEATVHECMYSVLKCIKMEYVLGLQYTCMIQWSKNYC